MLDEKLAQAARQRHQNMLLAFLAVVIILLGGLLFWLIPKALPDRNAAQVVISDKDAPEAAEKPNAPPAAIISKRAEEKPSEEQLVERRREFVELLSRYEKNLEPDILSKGFSAWNRELKDEFSALKEKAKQDFTSGDVEAAYEVLVDLLARASNSLNDFDGAFFESLEVAEAAYGNDQAVEADVAVTRALSYRPQDSNTLELKEKIDRLPAILDLIKKAEVARVENNLEKERELLQQILTLDSTRTGYADRIKEVEQQIKDNLFERTITLGLEAVELRDLKNLERAIGYAKRLYPNREEVAHLEAKKEELEKQFAVARFLKQANDAVTSDRWHDALTAFTNAGSLDPKSPEIQEGITLSATVLKYDQAVDDYLAKPERLANDRVAKQAKKTVQEAEVYGALSHILRQKISQLDQTIKDWGKLVEVVIVSDGQTFISVKGLGQVGKKTRYKIQLKPGQYAFEGRREGYRAKIVPLTIKPGAVSVQVEVITDERI